MIKWLFIIAIAVGAIWHFTGKNRAPQEAQTIPSAEMQAPASEPAAQAPPSTASRVPSEEQCRSIGGRIISGTGCVVGAPGGNSNPQASPAEMEAYCISSGKRYVRELNACVSS